MITSGEPLYIIMHKNVPIMLYIILVMGRELFGLFIVVYIFLNFSPSTQKRTPLI